MNTKSSARFNVRLKNRRKNGKLIRFAALKRAPICLIGSPYTEEQKTRQLEEPENTLKTLFEATRA